MDRRVRELERRVALGDESAKSALLNARVHAGEISQDALELAAYLGHEDAAIAMGRHYQPASKQPRRFIRGLLRFGKKPAILAMLIAHRATLTGVPGLPEAQGWKRRRIAYSPIPEESAEIDIREAWKAAIDVVECWMLSSERRRNVTYNDRSEIYAYVDLYDRRRIRNYHYTRFGDQLLQIMNDNDIGSAIESAYNESMRHLSPTFYSKWGRDKADSALRKEIARILVPWALDPADDSDICRLQLGEIDELE